jgi:hypothetical protein
MISDAFYMALTILEHELRWSEARTDEACIFGSASLVMRGVIDREPGDIDVFVSRRVWGILLAHGWGWETPDAGNPPMLIRTVAGKKICLWFDWSDPWLSIDVTALLREHDHVEFDGSIWPLVPLSEAKRHKQEAIRYPHNSKRKLHEEDIAAIDKVLT